MKTKRRGGFIQFLIDISVRAVLVISLVLFVGITTAVFTQGAPRTADWLARHVTIEGQKDQLTHLLIIVSSLTIVSLYSLIIWHKEQKSGWFRFRSRHLPEPASEHTVRGYVVLALPDSKKKFFADLLSGFENYAELKGYSLSYSVDSSLSGNIIFELAHTRSGNNVSVDQVRQDLGDYLERIVQGKSLDDLPRVISPEKHILLLEAFKNRVDHLQHAYDLHKGLIEDYRTLLATIAAGGSGASTSQTINIYGGSTHNVQTFQAVNSPQSVQGDRNRFEGNTGDQNIWVGSSSGERKIQIDCIGKLRRLILEHGEAAGNAESNNIDATLRKVEDELNGKEKPDPKRIMKWLETTKDALKALALTKEVHEGAKAVWEVFKLPHW